MSRHTDVTLSFSEVELDMLIMGLALYASSGEAAEYELEPTVKAMDSRLRALSNDCFGRKWLEEGER